MPMQKILDHTSVSEYNSKKSRNNKILNVRIDEYNTKSTNIAIQDIVILPVFGIIHGLEYLYSDLSRVSRKYKNNKISNFVAIVVLLKILFKVLLSSTILYVVVSFTFSSFNPILTTLILFFIVGIIGENLYRKNIWIVCEYAEFWQIYSIVI